jgi:hypothetical protein
LSRARPGHTRMRTALTLAGSASCRTWLHREDTVCSARSALSPSRRPNTQRLNPLLRWQPEISRRARRRLEPPRAGRILGRLGMWCGPGAKLASYALEPEVSRTSGDANEAGCHRRVSPIHGLESDDVPMKWNTPDHTSPPLRITHLVTFTCSSSEVNLNRLSSSAQSDVNRTCVDDGRVITAESIPGQRGEANRLRRTNSIHARQALRRRSNVSLVTTHRGSFGVRSVISATATTNLRWPESMRTSA